MRLPERRPSCCADCMDRLCSLLQGAGDSSPLVRWFLLRPAWTILIARWRLLRCPSVFPCARFTMAHPSRGFWFLCWLISGVFEVPEAFQVFGATEVVQGCVTVHKQIPAFILSVTRVMPPIHNQAVHGFSLFKLSHEIFKIVDVSASGSLILCSLWEMQTPWISGLDAQPDVYLVFNALGIQLLMAGDFFPFSRKQSDPLLR